MFDRARNRSPLFVLPKVSATVFIKKIYVLFFASAEDLYLFQFTMSGVILLFKELWLLLAKFSVYVLGFMLL